MGDKQLYNKFNHRLRQCDETVKDEYRRLVAKSSNEDIKTMVQQVMSAAGPLPPDMIRHKRTHTEDTERDEDEEWVSWAEAAKTEGEEVLLELVETKAVASRRHPKLGPDSKIKYPYYLQIHKVRERVRKKKHLTKLN